MKKDEFLQLLRRALTGNVAPGVIEENIRYYDGYITGEMGRGIQEDDVIAEIGDPRLIAKTIEDTTDSSGQNVYTDEYDNRGAQANSSHEQNPYGPTGSFRTLNLNKWYWKALLIVIIFSVISLVVTIVGGIFSILIPLIGPLLMIWAIVWIIRSFSGR